MSALDSIGAASCSSTTFPEAFCLGRTAKVYLDRWSLSNLVLAAAWAALTVAAAVRNVFLRIDGLFLPVVRPPSYPTTKLDPFD